jgi:hypothetical protein
MGWLKLENDQTMKCLHDITGITVPLSMTVYQRLDAFLSL